MARGLARVYWRLEVSGADNVPAEGPVIIAPVHRSFVDFLVAACVTRRKVFFMAKDELWKSKMLGRFLESVGAFPVDRANADRMAIGRSQSILERGEALIVFPEGERRFGSVIENLHEGAAFLPPAPVRSSCPWAFGHRRGHAQGRQVAPAGQGAGPGGRSHRGAGAIGEGPGGAVIRCTK